MYIKIDRVQKYFGEKCLFEALTYTFTYPEVYVIQGVNGIGKTTLMNMIYGYDCAYEGTIDNSVGDIIYLLQDDMLFRNLTVKDNLLIALFSNHNVSDIEVQLNRSLDLFDLHEVCHQKVSHLSGGERKKVALAQMLLKNSKVVLLDEPTSSLQKDLAKELVEKILKIFKDKLVIVVSHDDIWRTKGVNVLKLDKGGLYE
ncbi:ABC transporter ATP-binding protein [Fusibacter sp. JL298sf-3]